MKSFLERLKVAPLDKEALRNMAPNKFAYLGDVIYELYVRNYVIIKEKGKMDTINREAVRYVNASAQAAVVKALEEELTPGEWKIVIKARNYKSGKGPRNADLGEYRYATGFEALLGYLFLGGSLERMEWIIARGIKIIDESEEKS
ncbi:MAG: hypothetical protein AVO33_02295 [delta proteobacterium ML8_F1]|nr:MAG: hypothetical protein AVO33_02295 [delta proteobacterium ML8_F1]